VDRHLRRQHAGRQLPLRCQRLGAPPGEPLGTRREIKNLNSFRFMQQAIDYEVQWQINEIEEGRKPSSRPRCCSIPTPAKPAPCAKEDAHDYRYFPDPDLLPLEIGADWIAEVQSGMPELPQAMQARFQADYGLSAYDAAISPHARMARLFRAAVAAAPAWQRQGCANWIMGELAARLNKNDMDIEASPISAAQLAGLIRRIADNTISNNIAKKVFEALWNGEGSASADEIIEKQGLKQITDTRRHRDDHRRGAGRQPEIGRGIPRRQGKGLQCAGRPGDEGDQGQGQPAAGQ
jgi:aspartyl-tRNA(Asn)/glutamyl-tRNA(Gln) amidotransferase subunit B